MKKTLSLFLAIVMVFALCACGQNTAAAPAEPTEVKDGLQQQQEGTAKLEEASQAAAEAEEGPVSGGTLVVGCIGDAGTFNAAVSTDTNAKILYDPMAIGLLNYDASNNMEPVCSELAESYEFSDDYIVVRQIIFT